MIQKKEWYPGVIICLLCCFTINSFAQYQAGDTIEIRATTYEEEIIEAEWNATNVTPIEGKNVPVELDGRIVIGNTKTGSILGYPIHVGAAGGTFIMSIDYKGFSGFTYEGYIYLSIDDGQQEKIWLRTEGWNVATSKAFELTPGYHVIYTQYKGNSGTFNIDRFRLNALPGTLQEKPVRQLSALTYSPEIIEVEDFDEGLSSITAGKGTVEGDDPTYVTDLQNGDTLTYPVRVGAGGGQYNVRYRYKKLSDGAASIRLCIDESVLYSLELNGTASSDWASVSAPIPVSLRPGYQKIKIVFVGSDTHQADYLELSPVANSLKNAHPIIFVNAVEKAATLEKIDNYEWAQSIFKQTKNNVAGKVLAHRDNPEAILATIPAFGEQKDHTALQLGLNAAIVYFLNSDESYAQFAADILAYYCKKLATKTPQTAYILNDHFSDGRITTPYIALIYDFIYGYVKYPGTRVYDIDTKAYTAFDNEAAQKTLKNIAGYILQEFGQADTHGRTVSNHPILTASGALFPILCVEDSVERERLFNVFWNKGTWHQASFTKTIMPMYGSQGIWPESVSYSFMSDVPKILNIVDRLKPELNVANEYRHILEGSLIFPNLKDPTYTYIRYGDSKRYNESSDNIYRMVMAISERNGFDDLQAQAANTLQQYYNSVGGYNPELSSSIYAHSQSINLFWGMPIPDSIEGVVDFKPTVIVKHAGVALQRNFVEENNEAYGLNGYIGGAHYVHSHCTGIAMELYGAGYVMAPNGGLPPSTAERGDAVHTDYFRLYAGNNTVIVNGTSHGKQPGSWKNDAYLWQNTTVNIAAEPRHLEDPVSTNFSFATQFLDDNVNNCDQQRTLSVIRTSPTTGYYLDVFRSKSLTSNNFHDYVYHNLGDKMSITDSEGTTYALTATNKYDNDIGDPVHSPGWRFFEEEKTTAMTSDEVKVRFDIEYDNKYMHLSIPGGMEREYTKALAPPTREARDGYVKKKTQVLAIRQHGEAWNRPYITILEPSANSSPSVQTTQHLMRGNTVVGVKVVSKLGESVITDYIISQATPDSIHLPAYDITFEGRFAILRTVAVSDTHEDVTLYIGEGSTLSYGESRIDVDGKGVQSFSNIEKVKTIPTYSLYVTSNADEGAVSQSIQQLEYLSGTEVTLTATPEEGYAFIGWSGSIASSENPITVSVDSNMIVEANFEYIPTFTLEVTLNADEGTVNQSIEQSEYLAGTEVVLTAIPAENYTFKGWSGSITTSENPITVVVDSNLVIEANFDLKSAVSSFESKSINISPNPSAGVFTIVHSGNDRCTYNIFDMNGSIIQWGHFAKEKTVSIDRQGTYIIRITSDRGVFTHKLVVL